MAIEIERKYLVDLNKWNMVYKPEGMLYRQGYLSNDPQKTVRIRAKNSKGYITIKGEVKGLSRPEFEYEIPLEDALNLLDHLASNELSKIRYKVTFEGKVWEVDEFLGNNSGLVVAEIELQSEDEPYLLPDWIGVEVTHDFRYYNSNLAMNPFNYFKEFGNP